MLSSPDAVMVNLQATKMLNEEISSLVGGLRSSSNSSLSAFARMEQKVEALEAEADAAGQMGVSPCCTASPDLSKLGPRMLACIMDVTWQQPAV